jgi:hypothetical protein
MPSPARIKPGPGSPPDRMRRSGKDEPWLTPAESATSPVWVSDTYNGATPNMIVADSCDDGNAWCKDDPYHVDLAQNSLNQFVLNGAPVGRHVPEPLE